MYYRYNMFPQCFGDRKCTIGDRKYINKIKSNMIY